MVGSGTTGVVLAHEYLADLCGAWPFADHLAKRGLRAFAVDLRCFGLSACPEGDAKGRVVNDVVAAVAELRRRATKVALAGASMGGSAVLIAGTRVQPPTPADDLAPPRWASCQAGTLLAAPTVRHMCARRAASGKRAGRAVGAGGAGL